MRWLLATALSALAVPASGQQSEAEKNCFAPWERKVRAAKVAQDGLRTARDRLATAASNFGLTASQQFAGANKARFELKCDNRGQDRTKSLCFRWHADGVAHRRS